MSAALRYGARNLWTANPPGVSVILRICDDPRSEAAFIVHEVRRLLTEGSVRSPGDCAALYRTNAQARDLEMACLEAGLPYSVRGNSDFLARKEIRDLFAYLRLLHNPQDVAALGRIINTPPRRLAALEKRIRSGNELTLARLADEFPCGLTANRGAKALGDFLEVVRMLTAMAEGPPGLLIEAALEMTGYRNWLRSQDDGEKRLANLTAFHDLAQRSDAEDLREFLDELSLAGELDTGSDPQGLALSTIHAAKGLEWPIVFVAGLEEGLLPHARALEGLEVVDGGPLEEELRLCYVAATRAIDRLYLTYAACRGGQGRVMPAAPSRFLRSIPAELVERWVA